MVESGHTRCEIHAIRVFSSAALAVGLLFLFLGLYTLGQSSEEEAAAMQNEMVDPTLMTESTGIAPAPEDDMAALLRDRREDLAVRYLSAAVSFLIVGGLLHLYVKRIDRPAPPANETWEEESSAFFATPSQRHHSR